MCHISTTWATWKCRNVLQAMSMVFLHPFVSWFMQCTVGCNSQTFLNTVPVTTCMDGFFSLVFSLLSLLWLFAECPDLADFHVVCWGRNYWSSLWSIWQWTCPDFPLSFPLPPGWGPCFFLSSMSRCSLPLVQYNSCLAERSQHAVVFFSFFKEGSIDIN